MVKTYLCTQLLLFLGGILNEQPFDSNMAIRSDFAITDPVIMETLFSRSVIAGSDCTTITIVSDL